MEKMDSVGLRAYYKKMETAERDKLVFYLVQHYGKSIITWRQKLLGYTNIDLCELTCINNAIEELNGNKTC